MSRINSKYIYIYRYNRGILKMITKFGIMDNIDVNMSIYLKKF